ncbi:MAG TPA: hypothetical protein PKA64_16985 [Myxococcota bacterium]|nr:hypothetical protein [Myxococcota bacterium]
MRRALLAMALLVGPAAEAVPQPAQAVYEIHPDLRDCLYPMCGGWFVARVNQAQMRCPNGSMAAQCYVLEIDWPALGLDPADETALIAEAYQDRVLVRASQYGVNVPNFGWFGALRPSRAWVEFP